MDIHERNPRGLKDGDACYGVFLPAFLPGSDILDESPEKGGIIHGKAVTSYDHMPVGGRDDAVNFLPDEPFAGTSPMDAMYDLSNWAIFPSRPEAMAKRALLSKALAEALQARIDRLASFM